MIETYHIRRLMLLNNDFVANDKAAVSFKSYYTVLLFAGY